MTSEPLRVTGGVACALEWRAQLFVSSDKRQVTGAEKGGLDAKSV